MELRNQMNTAERIARGIWGRDEVHRAYSLSALAGRSAGDGLVAKLPELLASK